MVTLIDSITCGESYALAITTQGGMRKNWAAGTLALFDRPSTCNGPTEAIRDRFGHLHGTAFDLRNLTKYIAR